MGSAPFTEDYAHVRFRLRNVQAGAAISTVAASAFLLYELLTWDRPHRGLVATVYVLTVLFSAVLCRLDLEPIMRRPLWRETFFLAWSAYRSAMPVADALVELRRCAGRQFDARCVELLAVALSGEGAGTVDDVVGLR